MNTIMSIVCGWLHSLHEFGHCGENISNYLCSYLGHAIVIGAAFVLLALMILFITNKCNRIWNFISRNLLVMFIIAWLFGFAVYDVGMYTGNAVSILSNAPMAVLHALGMFVLNSDVSEIHEEFHNNACFMGCFSFAHLFAAFVSLVFVIKHFGFNVIAILRMFFASTCLSRKKDVTYVFWGMNDGTYHLANSIKKHHPLDKNYRMIIVRTNNDNEATSAKNGMERLFNFLSLKNKDLSRLMDLDCLTTNTFGTLSVLNSKEKKDGQADILKKNLNMQLLCKIIKNRTRKEVHWFFLSEDEENNIKSVANLKTDVTINGFVTKAESDDKKVILYCHTRNNSIHRVIENDRPIEGIEVKVMDSSQLCVDLLKYNQEYHPVNYVEIENDATVSSSFNALVVGFGQVGLDVVRFLYEFGAFVKTGSTQNNVIRSDFLCNVVDKDMPDLAGQFVANAPSVKSFMSFRDNNSESSPLIALHHMDCQSVEFYESLIKWIRSLNYAVIATGDDEMNISLGVRILRLAIRYRENLNHFRVLVRVSKDEDDHFGKIAQYYNRLWEAEQKKDTTEKLKRQRIVPSDALMYAPITLFGSMEDTYQYDYIVNDKLKTLAKKFKQRYDESIQALQIQSNDNIDNIVSWDDEYKSYMQMNEDFVGYAPTYSNVMKLHRMQSQNFENCFHVHTKQRLAMCALGADEYVMLTSRPLYRKNNEITYQWKSYVKPNDNITKVLDTLAQTEHLRWNASHEILGYMEEGDEKFKNEAKLLHGCLKNWQDLTSKTQSYDYNVVDVSLDIIELKQKKK